MIFLTHVSFALLLGLLYQQFMPTAVPAYLFVTVVAVSGIFPDIDCSTSMIGKKFKALSLVFEHRTFFHSLPMMIIGAITISLFLPSGYSIAFMLGIVSHLALDSLTPSGLMLFWPSGLRFRGPVRTGKLGDMFLFVSFTGLIVAFLFVVHNTLL